MDTNPQRPNRREGLLSSLSMAIDGMNLAKEATSMTPAKGVFGSVSILLTMIRDSMVNKIEYVELGLACADVCRALDRGVNERQLGDLSQSVREAIAQLKTTIEEIREEVAEKGRRGAVSRGFHARSDKEVIVAWKSDLNRVLQVFNTELAINTHVMVSDIHRNVLAGQEGIDGQHRSTQARPSSLGAAGSTTLHSHGDSPGELPPPPPRACFGRDELIERIVGLAENLTPLAFIGAGGIGKTAIALTVLHHDRIKELFGDNRRFIRCDQFPASRAHFLSRLARVIGAGVENPDDLAPLRPFLSSTRIIIVLDNAESILDPQGTHAQEIYDIVEELSHFSNICLCITSQISTIPPDCKTLDIPTLSMEAAHSAFYHIHEDNEDPDLVDNILEQLDFHPLSVTLLATVAHQNRWNNIQLAREWEQHRTGVLQTEHKRSLAATIELSLASPMFQDLGPNARELLGVIAFFPQGVSEDSIDWLFPTRNVSSQPFLPTPPKKDIFDKFCVLSLTYQSNGSITMLAPLQDYFCPKDPMLSPLLQTTKKYYFSRLSGYIDPDEPGFEGTQWITTEDVNVEHLLDVFTSIDANPGGVWTACWNFMHHLCWHKPRLVVIGPKVEGLPDDHHSKPQCLYYLAWLISSVGNRVECKRLLTHALGLWRKWRIWNIFWVAKTLRSLSHTNMQLGLHAEGIQQAKEALRIYKWVFNKPGQARTLELLARSLFSCGQLDAAQEAVSQATNLLPNKGEQFSVCQCYTLLGQIHQSKGETDTVLIHFETALRIAFPFNWHHQLSYIHRRLAGLFFGQGKFDEAHTHIEHAKSHAIDDNYNLGWTIYLHAEIWYKEQQYREAKSEALHAVAIFEKLGAAGELENCEKLLCDIKEEINNQVTAGRSDSSAGPSTSN